MYSAAPVVFVAGHVLWRLFNWESFFFLSFSFIQFSLRSLHLFIICCCYYCCDYECVATCHSWANERMVRSQTKNSDVQMVKWKKFPYISMWRSMQNATRGKKKKTWKLAFYCVDRMFSIPSVQLRVLVLRNWVIPYSIEREREKSVHQIQIGQRPAKPIFKLETWKSVSRNGLQHTNSAYTNGKQIVVDVFYCLHTITRVKRMECGRRMLEHIVAERMPAFIQPSQLSRTRRFHQTKLSRSCTRIRYFRPATRHTHTNKQIIFSMRKRYLSALKNTIYCVCRVAVCGVTCCVNVCASSRPINPSHAFL